MNNYSRNVLLDQEYIESLRAMDNGATFNELIEISKELMPVAIKDLGMALKNQNQRLIETISHKLKGSAGTIGAIKIADFIEEICLKAGKPAYNPDKDLKQLKMLTTQSLKLLLKEKIR